MMCSVEKNVSGYRMFCSVWSDMFLRLDMVSGKGQRVFPLRVTAMLCAVAVTIALCVLLKVPRFPM